MHPFQPPERLGPWQLVERIGAGGVATVWRARHDDGSEAAIKLLHHPDPSAETRLRRESAVLASLDHPHVVRARELLEVDGVLAVVMELVHGPALATWADGRSEAEVCALWMDVLDAVQVAHRAGVVHRDLKPSNILLTDAEPPRAKVADFGIARDGQHVGLTATGVILGTPLYMAPEQVDDPRRVGPSADVFSLGATLYTLLCGRPPFVGDSPLEVLDRARRGLYSDPGVLRPDLSEGTRAALGGALAADPAHRIPDVATFRDVLLGVVEWEAPVGERVPRTWAGVPAAVLIGRDQLLDEVASDVAAGGLVTLVGPIGVGKSAVAAAVVRAVAGGRLVELGAAEHLPDVLQAVAVALDCVVPWSHVDQLAGAVRQAVLQTPLVVLDGCHPDPAVLEQLVAWRDAGATLLVTSSSALGVARERVHEVPPLSEEDACRLLRRLAPGITASDASLRDLVRRVSALPLALKVVAPLLETSSVDDAWASWSRSLQQEGPVTRAVRRALQRLDPAERSACAQLAIFEDGFRPEAAAAVLRSDEPVPHVLRRLRERHLLWQAPSPAQRGRSRLRMYPHVQQSVRQAFVCDEAVQERFVAWAASLGSDPDAWVRRGGDTLLRGLVAERANLEAAWALADGPARTPIALAREALVQEERPVPYRHLLRQLVFDLLTAGRHDEAQQVVQDAAKDPRLQESPAESQAITAILLSRTGDVPGAAEALQQALRDPPSAQMAAGWHRNLAHLHAAQGNVDDAVASLDASRAWYEQQGSLRQRAYFHLFDAELHFHTRGEWERLALQSLHLFQQVDLPRGSVDALRMVCVGRLFEGRVSECLEGLPELLALTQRYGWRDREVHAECLLAMAHLLQGRLDVALEHGDRAGQLAAGFGPRVVAVEDVVYIRVILALACDDPVTAHDLWLPDAGERDNLPLIAIGAEIAARLGDEAGVRAAVAQLRDVSATGDQLALVGVHLAAALTTVGDEAGAAHWRGRAEDAAAASGMGPDSYVGQRLAGL
ncbi:MAG: protein kinase [Myxococcales bacterium]|nr:protein kinase [Myxococcales bacterium]